MVIQADECGIGSLPGRIVRRGGDVIWGLMAAAGGVVIVGIALFRHNRRLRREEEKRERKRNGKRSNVIRFPGRGRKDDKQK